MRFRAPVPRRSGSPHGCDADPFPGRPSARARRRSCRVRAAQRSPPGPQHAAGRRRPRRPPTSVARQSSGIQKRGARQMVGTTIATNAIYDLWHPKGIGACLFAPRSSGHEKTPDFSGVSSLFRGARDRSRTCTILRTLVPETSASANSATRAGWRAGQYEAACGDQALWPTGPGTRGLRRGGSNRARPGASAAGATRAGPRSRTAGRPRPRRGRGGRPPPWSATACRSGRRGCRRSR